MTSRKVSSPTARFAAVICFLVAAGFLLPVKPAGAADRQFLVILANAPKQYPDPEDRNPRGQPLGGLTNPQLIWDQYFDTLSAQVGSFAEYWEEISYGDVTILGDVADWINLPWPIQPPLLDPERDDPENPPVDDSVNDITVRHTPAAWYDLFPDGWFRYGEGELVDNRYAAAIIDTDGDPNGRDNGPDFVGPGSRHVTERGYPVWKPGERFIDMDEDGKWDGLDEANNLMDWNADGQPDNRGPWVDLNLDGEASPSTNCVFLADSDNDGNPDCCPAGPGESGCGRYGSPGSNMATTCPPTRWDGPSGEIQDCNGNLIPDACDINPSSAACVALQWPGPFPDPDDTSGDVSPQTVGDDGVEDQPDDIPDECQFVNSPCTDETCEPLPDNENRTTLFTRCEYDDSNFDSGLDIVEPFENFLRRWDPCIHAPEASPPNRFEDQAHWVKVYDPSSPFAGTSQTCTSPSYSFDYGSDDYIQDNYPGRGKLCTGFMRTSCDTDADCPSGESCLSGADELVAEAGGRLLWGSHDPLDKLPTIECECADGCGCGPMDAGCIVLLYGLDLTELPDANLIPKYCVAGMHTQYDPPDAWENQIAETNTPTGDPVYTTKMQAAPGQFDGRAEFIDSQTTAEPPWYEQAWGDRYREDNPNYDDTEPPGPNNQATLPRPAPAWPTAGENILEVRPFPDVNEEGYDPTVNRRFFKANAGGTTIDPFSERRVGVGIGWVGCGNRDPDVLFETGDVGDVGFVTVCSDRPILPEEAEGTGDPPIFYDGWVEHDDLPSSKYHRAGDEWLGEITSPFNNQIWGDDIGPHLPGSIPQSDGRIPAAGPYATDIHGNLGFDAGNVLTMELLTWRVRPPFNDGRAWEYGLLFDGRRRYHPYAGPSGVNLGFRDFNLDGLLDLGESRFGGSNTQWAAEPGPDDPPYVPGAENYVADSHPYSRNTGVDSRYPFNRRRLVEDCIEVLDRLIDFDDYVDPVSLAAYSCNRGTPSTQVPVQQQGLGGNTTIFPDGLASGVVLLPPLSFLEGNMPAIAPSYYAVHNEDGDNLDVSFPRFVGPGDERISWNLFFHDLVLGLGTSAEAGTRPTENYQVSTAAHEYLHTWEAFPDLYDYDVFGPAGVLVNHPVGVWDIMAEGGLVHSIPILKEKPCTEWIEPVDLTSVLTPGVDTTLTLPPYEFVRDNSAYFLENESRAEVDPATGELLTERYYFWSAGLGFDDPEFASGGFPGTGMLIAHTEVGANPDALPSGQSNGTRFQYVIVQADGLGELDAGISPYGDDGDPWPGSTGATRFNFETNPRATWYTLNAWTGIDVLDVIPDGSGSVQLQINWVPTLIPSLRFINPPGGASVNSIYQVNFDATDVFGGTTIQVYYTQDPTDITIQPNQANLVGSLRKTTPGTRRLSVNWDVRNIPDSRYFLFAKLVPGPGADGSELEHTEPRGGRNNQGDGGVDVSQVGIASNKARSETWALVCIDPQGEEWLVNSSLSQPVPADTDPDQDPYPHASTCPESAQPFCNGYAYTSVGGEVTFTIEEGDTPFTIGDTFSFTTTGITATSRAVSVTGGRISESPTAAIFATPLAGPPPLRVSFDGRDSTDPDGQALQFQWTFGDGSQPATGARVEHTYTRSGTFTAILRATNPLNGRFGEASVDIEVTNNSPKARISAEPTSGPAPLTVNFSGSQSSDTETDPEDLIYQWEFGDGGTANSAGQPGVSISTEHFYTRRAGGSLCTAQDPCTFVAALTVTDEGGKQDTDTVTIHVGNTAPVASVSFTRLQGTPPHEVTFNAINSTDAEGHDLTVTWSWGDPKPDETYPVEGPAGDGFVPHVYDLPQGVTSASYHTSATITDELGASTEWPGVTVLVSEQLAGTSDPVAAFTIDPDPPLLNEEFKVDAGLSFDRPSGGLPSKFIWDWDDQTTTSVKADGTVPDACRAVAPQDSCVTATHTYTQSGQYRITLTVCDDETPANCGTRTRTVRVEREDTGIDPSTNRRPTAVITVTPTEGIAGQTEFTFDGRNSVDPDDDALTYSWNFGDGSPRDSRPEAPHVYSDPGTYTVTLTVTDTSNASHDARMTITVRSIEGNRDPLAFIGTGPRTGTVPLTLTFNGENSFDPDGDPLTFRWEFYLGETLNGTATGPAVTYTFSQEGVYSVILEVSDGRGGVTPSGAEIVQVTARVPGPGNDNDNGGDEEPGRDIPDSADQRNGGFCGLGMLTSFFGSLLGLSVMRLTRRRLGA